MNSEEKYSLKEVKDFSDIKKFFNNSSFDNLDFRVMHYGDITNHFKNNDFSINPLLGFLECNIPKEFDYLVEHYTENTDSTKNKFVFYRKHPKWKMEKYFATISFRDN